jgi:hypothetical protein
MFSDSWRQNSFQTSANYVFFILYAYSGRTSLRLDTVVSQTDPVFYPGCVRDGASKEETYTQAQGGRGRGGGAPRPPSTTCSPARSGIVYTVKKRLSFLPSSAGMSLTKLSRDGNTLIIPVTFFYSVYRCGV